VDEGLTEAQSVRDFLNAMNLREAADYEAEFSLSSAKAVISSGERFIEKIVSILMPNSNIQIIRPEFERA